MSGSNKRSCEPYVSACTLTPASPWLTFSVALPLLDLQFLNCLMRQGILLDVALLCGVFGYLSAYEDFQSAAYTEDSDS